MENTINAKRSFKSANDNKLERATDSLKYNNLDTTSPNKNMQSLFNFSTVFNNSKTYMQPASLNFSNRETNWLRASPLNINKQSETNCSNETAMKTSETVSSWLNAVSSTISNIATTAKDNDLQNNASMTRVKGEILRIKVEEN